MKTWKKAAAVLFAAVLAGSVLMPGLASHAAETGKKAGKVSIGFQGKYGADLSGGREP